MRYEATGPEGEKVIVTIDDKTGQVERCTKNSPTVCESGVPPVVARAMIEDLWHQGWGVTTTP